MSNIEEIFSLLEYIEKNDFELNILNIFLDFKGENYLKKYKNIINDFNKIEKFSDCKKYFSSKYLNYVKYIKIYYVLDKNNKNIILFNSNIYDNLEEIEENKNNIYTNDKKNLIYNIKKYDVNTKKLINFLINEPNFINNFSKKQNTKSFIYSKLWKNDILKTKEKVNLDLLNYKNNTNTKVYKETKKYKIKKLQSIEFEIKKEKILTNARLSLPNTIILCFNDFSFVQLNKIVISNLLIFDDLNFKNFKEKIIYFFNVYKKLFNIDIYNINIKFNITVKKINSKKIQYNELVYKLDNKKILFGEKNINIKYIKTLNEMETHVNNLNLYEKHFNNYKEKFLKYNFENYLLYLDNKTIEKFFDM